MLLALWPAIIPMLKTQAKEPQRIIYQPVRKIEIEDTRKRRREDDSLLLLLM